MKYFTKEWYLKMVNMNIYLGLKINNNNLSYQEIYNQEKIKFNSIQEKIKRLILNMKKNINLETQFELNCENQINKYKNILPKEVLSKIKDIRILGLGYVNKEEYNFIKEYFEDTRKYVDNIIKQYAQKEEKFENSLEFIKESFHDYDITNIEKSKDKLIICLDNNQNARKIVFKNYNMILDEDIDKSRWLYNEVYKIDDKYEIHILVSGNELREMIIQCEDIIME